MRHPKLALLAALTASIAFVSPVAAQAKIHPQAIHPNYAIYTGYTYPGNALGLAACNADGPIEVNYYSGNDWQCRLGQPDAGLYGLYVIVLPCYPCGCRC
jgi:hypothetical protein